MLGFISGEIRSARPALQLSSLPVCSCCIPLVLLSAGKMQLYWIQVRLLTRPLQSFHFCSVTLHPISIKTCSVWTDDLPLCWQSVNTREDFLWPVVPVCTYKKRCNAPNATHEINSRPFICLLTREVMREWWGNNRHLLNQSILQALLQEHISAEPLMLFTSLDLHSLKFNLEICILRSFLLWWS